MARRVLARQGRWIREIARQRGRSRNTVKRCLRDAGAERYGPRAASPTRLDTFEPYVPARIEAARPQSIPAVVLLREITGRGDSGELTQLEAFVNSAEGGDGPSRWCASRRHRVSRCRPTPP